jgi:hypothetical protein
MLQGVGAVLVGLLVGLAEGAAPPAGRTAEEVIDRAIAAQGGPAQVARLQSVTFKARCTVYLGGQALSYQGTFAAHYPDRYRDEIVTNLGGQVHRAVSVVNGDVGLCRINQAVTSQGADRLKRERERLYQSYSVTLLPLKQKDFTLRLLGPAEVAGRQAVGVEVSSPGHVNQTLFFDEQSGLLVKSEVKVPGGPFGQLQTSEMHFLDYKGPGGVRYPSRLVTYLNGEKKSELVVTELTPGVTHAPGTFLWP